MNERCSRMEQSTLTMTEVEQAREQDEKKNPFNWGKTPPFTYTKRFFEVCLAMGVRWDALAICSSCNIRYTLQTRFYFSLSLCHHFAKHFSLPIFLFFFTKKNLDFSRLFSGIVDACNLIDVMEKFISVSIRCVSLRFQQWSNNIFPLLIFSCILSCASSRYIWYYSWSVSKKRWDFVGRFLFNLMKVIT